MAGWEDAADGENVSLFKYSDENIGCPMMCYQALSLFPQENRRKLCIPILKQNHNMLLPYNPSDIHNLAGSPRRLPIIAYIQRHPQPPQHTAVVLTPSALSLTHAQCRAPSPRASRPFTSAPASSRMESASLLRKHVARHSTVIWLGIWASTEGWEREIQGQCGNKVRERWGKDDHNSKRFEMCWDLGHWWWGVKNRPRWIKVTDPSWLMTNLAQID